MRKWVGDGSCNHGRGLKEVMRTAISYLRRKEKKEKGTI